MTSGLEMEWAYKSGVGVSNWMPSLQLSKQHQGMEQNCIYIATFIYYVYLKALRHKSHSFICKYTMPAFPL